MVPRSLLALVSLLLVGSVLAGSVGAAPPPRPVCAACGDTVEQRAEPRGLDVTVTDSTATVTVHANGTATWVVRNTVSDPGAVQRLRENATLRRALVDARYWDARLRSVTVSADGVVTARYRHLDFAVRSVGGTLRSDVFSDAYGYGNLHGLGADRLTVVAPDGTRIESAVPGATVSDDGSRMVLTGYDRGGFVTFVPRDATAGALWSWLAVADLVGPVLLVNAGVAAAVPAAVVAALVGALGGLVARLDAVLDWLGTRVDVVLVAGGAVGAAASLAGAALGPLRGVAAPVFGVAVAALAAGAAYRLAPVGRLTFRRIAGAALVATGVAAVVAAGAQLMFYGSAPWTGLRPPLFSLVALFAFAPAGYALQRGHRRRAVLTAAVGVALAGLLTAPLAVPVRIFGLSYRVLAAATGAVALVAAALPFLLVGAALVRASDGDGAAGVERA